MVDKGGSKQDGRYYCPYCGWSTQLHNKFERHLEKKHGGEIDGDAVSEMLLVVNPHVVPDTDEEE